MRANIQINILLITGILLSINLVGQTPFITTWQTLEPNESITIPTHPHESYSYSVKWGDGEVSFGHTGDATHTYDIAGEYQVEILGDFPRISFYIVDEKERQKIISIDQWGSQQWTSMGSAFEGCQNLSGEANDVPDLSKCTDLSWMFQGAKAFNQNLSNWDVSTITNTSAMFSHATSFNQDISSWDTGNILDMTLMFHQAIEFNQDLSSWNVSKVQNMTSMFVGASTFDQNLSTWDIKNVSKMHGMFLGAKLSTANYDSTLLGWSSQQLNQDIEFSGGNSTYCQADSARQYIIETFEWNIKDGGKDEDCLNNEPTISKQIDSTLTWVIMEYGYDDQPCIQTNSYKILHDTVINDLEYHAIYETKDGIFDIDDCEYYSAVRDSSGYWYFYVDGQEKLLYNYNIDIGDIIYIAPPDPIIIVDSIDLKVEAIDSVQIGGEYRKRFRLGVIYDELFDHYIGVDYWIEGIGSQYGLVTRNYVIFDWGYYITCLYRNDSLLHVFDSGMGDFCFCDEVNKTSTLNERQSTIPIFPNPTTGTVQLPQAFPIHSINSIYVTDLLGHRHEIRQKDERSIELPGIPGIFIITIHMNDGSKHIGKILTLD